MTDSHSAAIASLRNPYVGPRAFRRDELFFGREIETTGLVNTLVAKRIVLLHSPSGAGKTSLIQALLIPAMEGRDFQICARTAPDVSGLRVNAPPPDDFNVRNRYVYSVVVGLVGHRHEPEQLREWSISQALDELDGEPERKRKRQLLILDQFEEILTLDPTDKDGQREFFDEVGQALEDTHRWALFAMREDYLGGLDPYLLYVPGQFRSTFRLDLLGSEAAFNAIKEPARSRKVEFEDDAVNALVDNLRKVRVELPDGELDLRAAPYVQPVLVQVVCDHLWRTLSDSLGENFEKISLNDIGNYGPLDTALSRYYEKVVRDAADGDEYVERVIRDWVEEKLLTEQGYRGQTRSMPDLPNGEKVVSRLEQRYLVRADPRPGGTTWELSHDRLIDPVLEDNRAWRKKKLAPWRRTAHDWAHSHRDSKYLLDSGRYSEAKVLSRGVKLTQDEKDFLEESRRALDSIGKLRAAGAQLVRVKRQVTFLLVGLTVSVLCNILLLVLLLIGV
jgi:hypothetical protein